MLSSDLHLISTSIKKIFSQGQSEGLGGNMWDSEIVEEKIVLHAMPWAYKVVPEKQAQVLCRRCEVTGHQTLSFGAGL